MTEALTRTIQVSSIHIVLHRQAGSLQLKPI
ncbi:MAG: hypothetical protein AB1589_19285 [Cyanobacteriota bacterium]